MAYGSCGILACIHGDARMVYAPHICYDLVIIIIMETSRLYSSSYLHEHLNRKSHTSHQHT